MVLYSLSTSRLVVFTKNPGLRLVVIYVYYRI